MNMGRDGWGMGRPLVGRSCLGTLGSVPVWGELPVSPVGAHIPTRAPSHLHTGSECENVGSGASEDDPESCSPLTMPRLWPWWCNSWWAPGIPPTGPGSPGGASGHSRQGLEYAPSHQEQIQAWSQEGRPRKEPWMPTSYTCGVLTQALLGCSQAGFTGGLCRFPSPSLQEAQAAALAWGVSLRTRP